MRDASGLDWNSGRRKMRRGSGEVYAKLPVAADAMRVCPGTAAAVSLMQRKPDRGRLAPARAWPHGLQLRGRRYPVYPSPPSCGGVTT
ncbi:hypothetical protein [Burkholderia cepacia]|uniref:hypothetical protein n=1 Tax=Burkholderia cepacia TaxID=292 RepID=UPI00158CDC59|nr:hypothetical protein [Burkholderia cepacia]